jgi:hypothetical protein
MIDVDTFWGSMWGGIGGFPNDVHPFKGKCEINAYEFSTGEYVRKLHWIGKVKFLMTHASPKESVELSEFCKGEFAPEFILCRAPFNYSSLNSKGNYRGENFQFSHGRTSVIHQSVFQTPLWKSFSIEVGNSGSTSIEEPSFNTGNFDDELMKVIAASEFVNSSMQFKPFEVTPIDSGSLNKLHSKMPWHSQLKEISLTLLH